MSGIGCTGSVGPTVSATKRLMPAMAIGSSIEPRAQTVSQSAVQMRPQTLGKGFGSLATR
jgi:hypothetical protein